MMDLHNIRTGTRTLCSAGLDRGIESKQLCPGLSARVTNRGREERMEGELEGGRMSMKTRLLVLQRGELEGKKGTGAKELQSYELGPHTKGY